MIAIVILIVSFLAWIIFVQNIHQIGIIITIAVATVVYDGNDRKDNYHSTNRRDRGDPHTDNNKYHSRKHNKDTNGLNDHHNSRGTEHSSNDRDSSGESGRTKACMFMDILLNGYNCDGLYFRHMVDYPRFSLGCNEYH